MAAAAGGCLPVGSFAIVSKPPNWDELWIAGRTVDGVDMICRTTLPDGSDWIWAVVRPTPNAVVASGIVAGVSTAPAGVNARNVNWLCKPRECSDHSTPDAVEVISLTQEASRLM